MATLNKNLFKFMLLLLLPISSTFAAQNNLQNSTGVIQRIYLSGNNYFFRLQGTDTCAKNTNGYNEYYFFTTTNPLAKPYYALLLSAAISKKPITIRVKTDCNIDGQKEITYIFQDF